VAPLAVSRTWQRWRGLRNGYHEQRDIVVPPAPVNLAMTAMLRLEALWVQRFDAPFGSSLLCMARKPGREAVRQL
jgi:hypothetical protein